MGVTILDGATGSNLMERGLPTGVCVEQWILEHPEVLIALQQEFVAAGSNVVLAPTFGASPFKLKEYGLAEKTEEINAQLVALSKQAVGEKAEVWGDISPSGGFLKPFGELEFTDLLAGYAEQVEGLKQGGVDTVLIETQMTMADARAALLCAQKAGLKAYVTVTVEQNGRTLTGMTLPAAITVFQAMGAHGVGLNCSCGPESMAKFIEEAVPYANVPIIAKPNAGEAGHTLSPADFAAATARLHELGADFIGGCCGSTPGHIKALADALTGMDGTLPATEYANFLADEKRVYPIPGEFCDPILCSEDLTDDLMDAMDEEPEGIAIAIQNPADAAFLTEGLATCTLPVLFVSDNAHALEAALRLYQGRAMIAGKGANQKLAEIYGAIMQE